MLETRRLPLLAALALAVSLLPMAAHGEEQGGEESQPSEDACPDDTPPASFSDRDSIPEAHARNVDCAAAQGIAQGFSDNTYRPAAPMLRDAMASFIARVLDAADVELPSPDSDRFEDIEAGSTHDGQIHRLKAAGIVSGGPGGLPENHYGPRLDVRRDQMASFLVRALEFALDQEFGSTSQRFPDVGSGNPHFANVNAAGEQGLAHGRPDGRYGPGEAVRRDQMASFLVRGLEAVGAERVLTVGATGAPPAPVGVEAVNESSGAEGRVRVSWSPMADPHGRLAGYNVYYGEGETNTQAGSGITTVDAAVTTFTVGGLALDVGYTFAVTAVTSDGHESAKSAEVTARTTPPSVRITEPTSQDPAAVGPSATVQLTFEADTPEGGTYQVAYRENDADEDDAWTAFPETPDDSPGQIPAGAGTRTRTITAPAHTGIYDLRVVVTPTGGEADIHGTAAAALQVVAEPGDPTVEITQPTTAKPANAHPGEEGVTVAFTSSHDGEYVLQHRTSGQPDAPWTDFHDEPHTASEGGNEADVTAPGVGTYDLRVILTVAGGTTSQNVQGEALVVTDEPEDPDNGGGDNGGGDNGGGDNGESAEDCTVDGLNDECLVP